MKFKAKTWTWIFGIVLLWSVMLQAQPSELPEITMKGGRYYIYIDGKQEGGYYNIDTTAKAAATNLAILTRKSIVIKQPDITVTAKFIVVVSAKGSVELSWGIPTKRNDGSELLLQDIKGYSIRGNDTVYVVDGAETTSFIIEGLTTGAYEFTIATIAEEVGAYSKPLIQIIQ